VPLPHTGPVTPPKQSGGSDREPCAVTPEAVLRLLVTRAAERYRASGRFAYHFARGKLRTDPVFATLLAQQLLPTAPRLLDLGCGQGLVAAWLDAAGNCHLEGRWPQAWPAPPRPISIQGIEIDAHEVRRALPAVGDLAQIECADVRSAPLPDCDAILMLDVLHYMDRVSQKLLLERAHAALSSDGVLLLRIGNAAGGLRFTWSRWVDAAIWRLRGRRRTMLTFRTLAQWIDLLASAGFEAEEISMVGTRSFANVLLRARPRSPPPALLTPRTGAI
jgi:SAM-dependent methyltransferase